MQVPPDVLLRARSRKAPPKTEQEMQWDAYVSRAFAHKSEPFLDDGTTDEAPPSRAWEDIRHPKLRRYAFDVSQLRYVGHINKNPDMYMCTGLDGGMDGMNWKVRFADDGLVYVLKVFWDDEPPWGFLHYYAAQRECQNAALFHMMEAALAPEAADLGPILLRPEPRSARQAKDNLDAFSDERRQRCKARLAEGNPVSSTPRMQITELPRLRKCYGWLAVTKEDLQRRGFRWDTLEISKVKRDLCKDKQYTAVVYEFVEAGPNDPAAVQPTLDFLWRAGFEHGHSTFARNWKSSVLVDLSDVVQPRAWGWSERTYRRKTVEEVLRRPDLD